MSNEDWRPLHVLKVAFMGNDDEVDALIDQARQAFKRTWQGHVKNTKSKPSNSRER